MKPVRFLTSLVICVWATCAFAQSVHSQDCMCSEARVGMGVDDFSSYSNMQILEANAIYLTVDVPEITLDCPTDAILTINGDKTASTGKSRRFIVRNLAPGEKYEFTVVAITTNRAGIELQQTQTFTLKTGDFKQIAMKPIKRKT
ncbi:MAG: TIGR03000 domain-containing protein [Pirellulaceae bacterium]|nr:TIGR03000 domain-containing protein [Pirellulaceae bacterium]